MGNGAELTEGKDKRWSVSDGKGTVGAFEVTFRWDIRGSWHLFRKGKDKKNAEV